MLEVIRIANFAIIEQLELTLHGGLNVVTGETGAGKSIMIDAVELLLGGRAEASMVRAGADKAVIEGIFYATDAVRPLVEPALEREELTHPDDPAMVVLTREIRKNGRTLARINGTTVKAALLTEIGGYLVDIHGQSEHLSLLRPRTHIDLLDHYAGLLEMRSAIGELVVRLSHLRDEMGTLQHDKDALAKRAERLLHEINEIDAAALEIGEDDELRAERNRLSNSEQLAKLAGEASILLNGDDEGEILGALDGLQEVAVLLEKLAAIDPDLNEDAEQANTLAEQAADLALNLRGYAEEVEHDPERLNHIEERLELINRLRRRYGDSIDDILAYAEAAREELDGIDNSDERLKKLAKQEDELLHHIGELSERISKTRREAGDRLAAQIEAELQDLRMAAATFHVGITQTDNPNGCYVGKRRVQFDGTGIDDVAFMMTANPGEPLMPLAKVASGGETARIMLALKRALTLADPTDTLIFDEIDQGIGGRLGSVVGEKLWHLSHKHQVMVVTHLAQLAGFADAHFRVQKAISDNRTRTRIERLDDESDRADELAAMLGTDGESGERTARELLAAAADYKQREAQS